METSMQITEPHHIRAGMLLRFHGHRESGPSGYVDAMVLETQGEMIKIDIIDPRFAKSLHMNHMLRYAMQHVWSKVERIKQCPGCDELVPLGTIHPFYMCCDGCMMILAGRPEQRLEYEQHSALAPNPDDYDMLFALQADACVCLPPSPTWTFCDFCFLRLNPFDHDARVHLVEQVRSMVHTYTRLI